MSLCSVGFGRFCWIMGRWIRHLWARLPAGQSSGGGEPGCTLAHRYMNLSVISLHSLVLVLLCVCVCVSSEWCWFLGETPAGVGGNGEEGCWSSPLALGFRPDAQQFLWQGIWIYTCTHLQHGCFHLTETLSPFPGCYLCFITVYSMVSSGLWFVIKIDKITGNMMSRMYVT